MPVKKKSLLFLPTGFIALDVTKDQCEGFKRKLEKVRFKDIRDGFS